ncbi:hypothetical protein AB1E18_006969 [Capra hircus]
MEHREGRLCQKGSMTISNGSSGEESQIENGRISGSLLMKRTASPRQRYSKYKDLGTGSSPTHSRNCLRATAGEGNGSRLRYSCLKNPRDRGACNQHKLARQKNMKKQSDLVKGKRRDDGLSAAARKQRDSEIMQQKQKKANEKKQEPK